MNELKFPENRLAPLQDHFERIIEKSFFLQQESREAYMSYLIKYRDHELSELIDIFKIDLLELGKCFGLAIPPRVFPEVSQTKYLEKFNY